MVKSGSTGKPAALLSTADAADSIGGEINGAEDASNATWGEWTRCRNDDGLEWYYNASSGASVYEKPEGFSAPGFSLWK